jgi:DNA-binding transcriptional LysR family regulator
MRPIDQISRRLKLRHLNALVAVVEQGSMVKAAEQLAVSQPVVSKTIADLEKLLGLQLFERGRQGIEPTVYGRALLKRSVGIFDDLRAGISELEALLDPYSGELKIGVTEGAGTTLASAIIDRLARQYPRMVFDLVLSDAETLVERDLRGRRVDMVVGRIPENFADDLDITVLYRDALQVVAGIMHPLAKRRRIALADLVNERWVLPPSGHPIYQLIAAAFRRHGVPLPRSIVTVGSAPITHNFVAGGQFLGVLGSSFIAFNDMRSPLRTLPVELVPVWPVSVVMLKNRAVSPVAKLLLDCARELTSPLASAGVPRRASSKRAR